MHSGRERLRQWLQRSKLKQGEAAGLLGFDRSYLSQILGGKRQPGLASAIKIERVSGVPVEAWLPQRDGQPSEAVPDLAGNPCDGKA